MKIDCCGDTPQQGEIAGALSADPVNAPEPRDDPEHECLRCRRASRPVTRKTVFLMVRSEQFSRIGEGEYRFCSDPECPIVYFSEDFQVTFRTEDLRLRVGLKERDDPIPLCYCFGFDEKDAREEIAMTGASTIPNRIAELIKQKLCVCPARNPSGACCLIEVNQTIKRLMNKTVAIEQSA